MEKAILILLLLFTITLVSAQRGVINGTLQDENGPLPGANVIIKGTSLGTQSDFDGNYSLECSVGDVLVVSFIGFASKEITVTSEMMDSQTIPFTGPTVAVKQIKSLAYSEALNNVKDSIDFIPSLRDSPYLYTKEKGYRSFNHIKNIELDGNIVRLNHFSPEYFIEGSYNGNLRIRSVMTDNLPNETINPFATVASTSHTAYTSIFNDYLETGVALSQTIGRDSYNNSNYNSFGLSGNFKTHKSSKLPFEAKITYDKAIDRLANLNGFQNLVYAEQFLNSETGVSPFESLRQSESTRRTEVLGTYLSVSKNLNDDLALLVHQTTSSTSNKEIYGLGKGIFDYENGYSSQKEVHKTEINHGLHFDTDFEISDFIGLNTTTKVLSTYQNIDYSLAEQNINNPLVRSVDLSQHILEIRNSIGLEYDNFLFLKAGVTQLANSRQEANYFIPRVSISFIPTSAFYGLEGGFLNYINLTARYGETASSIGLLYNNYSHNTLGLEAVNANFLLNNVDLFFPEDLLLEVGNSFEYSLDTRLFSNKLSIGATYENRENRNGVFPIALENSFELLNVANTRTKGFGIEIKIKDILGYNSNANWTTGITLSRKRTKTTALLTENRRIPIAGFAFTNANLIAGESAGVIVGTAYRRNEQGNLITDSDGNPTLAEDLETIGDPTPNFNLGIHNNLKIGRWKVDLTVDYQNGGDIWNGSQKILNGSQGIDEFYIEDASYINLKSLTGTFELVDKKKWNENQHKPFFTSFTISVFGNNLITQTAFEGASPYSSLFDSTTDQSLHFFNTPLTTEVGLNLQAKF